MYLKSTLLYKTLAITGVAYDCVSLCFFVAILSGIYLYQLRRWCRWVIRNLQGMKIIVYSQHAYIGNEELE
jgi:hypothetical protein